nr:unnamed protein product [Digitaria exilis]
MGRPKGGAGASSSSSKKPKQKQKQRGGVDFKKYKHKVGRKLPPPKNATNTEIKSKTIVLPEQSLATERAGVAVNKRGLTLRELLQQTVHYNANVRRAAMSGIKDIVVKHPTELKLHKVAMIEKLQERICDTDKVVRESLYNMLQSMIFPALKEDNAISTRSTLFLLMANILNGMTHLSIDIQLMAFRFLELVVLNFPSSFSSYAEQVHNHSARELWKYTAEEDNSGARSFAIPNLLVKLQSLVQILVNSVEGDEKFFIFNLKIAEIFLCLSEWIDNTMFPAEEFCHFVSSLFSKAKTLRNKDIMEMYLSPLITCIPGLVFNAPYESKGYLLEEKKSIWAAENDPGMLSYHDALIHELPQILLESVDKAPSVTKVVLELLLRIGQYFPTMDFENLRPFIKLFGVECDALEPLILFRTVEILQSTYKAGNLQITEQLSFLALLIARFRVHPGHLITPGDPTKLSNWATFKSLNRLILTSLSEMGDGSLVLELMWNNLSNVIAQKPSMHNINGLFRIIVTLDAGTSKLINEDVVKLIAGYLVDASLDLSKTIEVGFQPDKTRLFQYFIKPCTIIFDKNDKVLCSTLEMLKSFVTGDDDLFSSLSNLNTPGELSCRVCVVTTILIFLCNDQKLHRKLSFGKSVIKGILDYIRHQLDSSVPNVTYEEKQKLKFAFEQLKTKALQLNCWDRSEIEGLSTTK